MNESAPKHIQDFCFKDLNDTLYRQICDRYQDEYTFVYKIKCNCGESKFQVFRDNQPSVFLKCDCCGKIITAYDLDFYPSATKIKKKFERERVTLGSLNIFDVYVVYQYDDEFEIEEDVKFDQNDISWGIIFIASDGIMQKILDDETS